MKSAYVRPLTLDQARRFIDVHHRHNKAPQGHRFSIGLLLPDEFELYGDDQLVGVVVVGRPVARKYEQYAIAEVTRLCVLPCAPKGSCSQLYRAAWRAWDAMGGQRIITYTLQSESGSSLRGAGWIREKELPGNVGKGWNTRDGRDVQDVVKQPKILWSCGKP